MRVLKSEQIEVRSERDMVQARQAVRAWSLEIGLKLVDQTKLVTAASELARNMLIYGQGGQITLEVVDSGVRKGLRLVFEDQGPGIPDIEQALQNGYTTGTGLGLGLGGAKRLVNEFHIDSRPGEGTRVTVIKWN